MRQSEIQVSGVGPKAALALLGPVDGYDLCEIITTAQITKLTSIPGVGPKTAERLVLELKDKLQKKLARKRDDIEIQKTKISENMAGSILNSNKASQKIEQKHFGRKIYTLLDLPRYHLSHY